MKFDEELDARDLNCPLPILRSKKVLTGMLSGQVLHLLSTDPGSDRDFAAFARQTGYELPDSGEKIQMYENSLGIAYSIKLQ
ncbi:MAG: sulfurtransferase TusA family protein [Burkholderiales bacterium]